ncbi:hypothetical protein ABZ725_37410 [Streptomyces sp. NPDC006872]|uniref:hypothetical protein n=1 Tax=Streptomyces sp. NPDC006872 TaxID=3155720 RepID=UPI00340BEB7F
MSGRLQAALDDLGASGGGVLKLRPGRYVLDNPLFIRDSKILLSGAGRHRTTLFFSRPLEETIGRAYLGNQSVWSWTGGQVFIAGRERLAASRAGNWQGSEGWLPGETLCTVAPASRGAEVLLVDDTKGITPGSMVLLEVDDPPSPDNRLLREIAGDVVGAGDYDWATRSPRLNGSTWAWPVVITKVLSSRTVRIEQPLRLTIHRGTPARLRDLGPTIHDSGVEGLTIENKLLPQTVHNINPGSNGVCFQAVHDCWARDVHVLNADVAFGMTAAKSCTLSGISAGGRSLHHFTITRDESHDNLIEDFVLQDFTVPAVPGAYLHGISVEALSSGNVWRRGTLHTGTFDSHRALPFENLRTDITLVNKNSVVGGAMDAGPFFGARTVHWGINVTTDQNYALDITDIAPRSLTAGITGASQTGSQLPRRGIDFVGDLESERLAFGTDLGRGRDLLDIQRRLLPQR